jgi:hypothetical protein
MWGLLSLDRISISRLVFSLDPSTVHVLNVQYSLKRFRDDTFNFGNLVYIYKKIRGLVHIRHYLLITACDHKWTTMAPKSTLTTSPLKIDWTVPSYKPSYQRGVNHLFSFFLFFLWQLNARRGGGGVIVYARRFLIGSFLVLTCLAAYSRASEPAI